MVGLKKPSQYDQNFLLILGWLMLALPAVYLVTNFNFARAEYFTNIKSSTTTGVITNIDFFDKRGGDLAGGTYEVWYRFTDPLTNKAYVGKDKTILPRGSTETNTAGNVEVIYYPNDPRYNQLENSYFTNGRLVLYKLTWLALLAALTFLSIVTFVKRTARLGFITAALVLAALIIGFLGYFNGLL